MTAGTGRTVGHVSNPDVLPVPAVPQLQVLDPVIGSVSVDVVDSLPTLNRASEGFLHDHAVFGDVTPRVGEGVAPGVSEHVSARADVGSASPLVRRLGAQFVEGDSWFGVAPEPSVADDSLGGDLGHATASALADSRRNLFGSRIVSWSSSLFLSHSSTLTHN